MEWKKERLNNHLLQLVLQYVIIVGIICFMLGHNNHTGILFISALLLVYGVFAAIFRSMFKDFFTNIIGHLIMAVAYGILVYMWIDMGFFKIKSLTSGLMLSGMIIIAICIMMAYSLRIVYTRTKLDNCENVLPAAVCIPVICCMVSQIAKSLMWQHVSVICFVVAVILMIVKNYARGAVKLRAEYGYDINYPGRQIGIVFNTLTLMLGMGVATVVSAVYAGPYGNYMLLLLKQLFYRLCYIVKLIPEPNVGWSDISLPEWVETFADETSHSYMKNEEESETPYETAMHQFVTRPETAPFELPKVVDNEWKVWAMFIGFMLVMLVLVVLVVEVLSQFVRTKRNAYAIGNDEFSIWHPGDDEDDEGVPEEANKPAKVEMIWKKIKYKTEEFLAPDKKSRAVRKLYKDKVMGESLIKKVNGVPSDITKKYITEDERRAEIITAAYEKARYSKEGVTKKEVQTFVDEMEERD